MGNMWGKTLSTTKHPGTTGPFLAGVFPSAPASAKTKKRHLATRKPGDGGSPKYPRAIIQVIKDHVQMLFDYKLV